ncbi:MAG: NUDIX domain-containing protein [Acidobacteria bacterium]|nr:NUDIX domain-containing protein [Acidobacteriota bacterium]
MIDKVGLLAARNGKILLCRKRTGTRLLILPGGKREPGETDLECLRRELGEEITNAQYGEFHFVGVYEAPAAGDESRIVRITLYGAAITGDPLPAAELAGLIWFHPCDDWFAVSPVIRERIFPDVLQRGLWPED